MWAVGALSEWLPLVHASHDRGAERGKGKRDEASKGVLLLICPPARQPTPHVMTVGPGSQFLFHVSDSPVVMACFKIARCLRL